MTNHSAIQDIQTELLEKEELIAALTERLELAADQLDRYQRNGKNYASTASSVSQSSNDQVELVQELQQMLKDQAGTSSNVSLEHISTQITELRQYIENNSVTSKKTENFQEQPVENSPTEPLSAWAAMKANILGDDAGISPDDEEQSGDKAETIEKKVQELVEAPKITWESLTLPEEIDSEEIDSETLHNAITNRDRYITYLVQKIRIAETVGLPDSWDEFEVPEDLQQQLKHLATRLEETLRLSEIEISMERARLSREDLRLQMIEHQAIQKLKKLGINIEDEEIDWEELEANQPEQGSRWLRLLGIGNDE